MSRADHEVRGFRLAEDVQPVGVFRKGARAMLRDIATTRSIAGARPERHRSGWPWVVSALARQQSPRGILLDDFIERTFHVDGWGAKPSLTARLRGAPTPLKTWSEDWVGIFHHPPNFPEWYQDGASPRLLLQSPRFRESVPHLRGAIALSRYQAEWLRQALDVPVAVIKHPTETAGRRFDWRAFRRRPSKNVVQVGWFLRNYRAIYQVDVPPPYRKVFLSQKQWFVDEARRRTDAYSPHRSRPDRGRVEVLNWLDPPGYDELLSQSIIFIELLDASANNTILEAIARHTPVLVNRHPAVEEYLGVDYPLFYDCLEDVPGLLDSDRVGDAHAYLRDMDTDDLSIQTFAARVEQFVGEVR